MREWKGDGTKAQHELEIIRLIAQGGKEIEVGVGFDMDEVFAEADKLIQESKP